MIPDAGDDSILQSFR